MDIFSCNISAIHEAAGPELRSACYKVPEVQPGVRCPTGEARITPYWLVFVWNVILSNSWTLSIFSLNYNICSGFRLPASHVIHTVGPIYDADKNPKASLRNAYRWGNLWITIHHKKMLPFHLS